MERQRMQVRFRSWKSKLYVLTLAIWFIMITSWEYQISIACSLLFFASNSQPVDSEEDSTIRTQLST
jgi:hypothetical protein